MKGQYTIEQKKAFEEIKTIIDNLVKKYNWKIVKWAFNRKMNWEKEKSKLLKQKKSLLEKLSGIEKQLK